MKIILRRSEQNNEGTFGQMFDDLGRVIAFTCERPDNGNQKMGCIPIGIYPVTQFNSPHNGKCFLLHDVPNRSMIEIHKGNTIDDIEGCILVGASFGEINNKKAVIGSRAKLEQMLYRYTDGFTLEVLNDFNAGNVHPIMGAK